MRRELNELSILIDQHFDVYQEDGKGFWHFVFSLFGSARLTGK
ncbi:MAG: hypothetical protein ACOH2A_02330 [Sphingobacteriaceae bacterium]